MKKIDINFIPQNIAPVGAKKIAIFDSNGNKINSIPLGNMSPKNLGTKLYSFGALSDVHLPYAAQHASSDFQKALTYFNNVANVNFICIAGDISDAGTEAEWLDYKNHVDTYSPNTPVHMCTGNHDTANNITYEYPIQYTGHPLWYSFTQGDDVFIMFGLRQWQGNNVFYDEALQWLYETLEENKDKRCFVFQHEMRLDGCGNAHGLYGWDGLAGKNGQVFLSLMEHYKNVIWFHGHSHTPFRLQSVQPTPIANYDRLHGCHSVHIPSLAIPRYGNADVIFDAEGYIVDVYDNGIHLRGIDFIEEEFVPIASYWIDTTPVDIPVESYTDATGTIKKKAIALPEDSELILNQRFSYSENGLVAATGMFVAMIPVNNMTGSCTVKIKNSSIPINTASSSVIYALDSNKNSLAHINGGNIPNMTEGITYSEDYKSADITFTLPNGCAYIALSLRVKSGINITAADIKEYIIEIEEVGKNEISLPEGSELYINQRYSHSEAELVLTNGMFAVLIPVDNMTGSCTVKIKNSTIPLNVRHDPNSVIYALDSNKLSPILINGGHISDMTEGITYSEDYKSADITFTLPDDCAYIALSLSVASGTSIGAKDIKDYIIEIEGEEVELPENETSLPEGTEVKANTQFSESGGGFREMSGYCTYVIPVEPETSYKFNIANIPSDNLNADSATIYELTADQVFNSRINGSKYIHSMTDTTISEDGTSAEVNFITTSNARYIAVSIIPGSVDPNNIRITLKALGVVLPQGDITDTVTWTMDKRLSSIGDPDKDESGAMASDYISVNPGDVINIYGISSLDNKPFYINFYKDEIFVFNIALSNAGVNPADNGYAYAKYDAATSHLIIQIKDMPVNSIRVCCVNSTVEVYRNAEAEGENEISVPEGSELLIGHRYSHSGGGYVADADGVKMFVVTIPVERNTNYLLTCKNLNILLSKGGSTLYLLDSNKSYAGTVNGSNNFNSMKSGITILDNGKDFKVEFVTSVVTEYIAVSILANIDNAVTADDIKDHIITLEKLDVELETSEPEEITSNVTWTADTRFSSDSGDYKTQAGIHASNDILVKRGDVIRIYGATLWSNFAYVGAYSDSGMLSVLDTNQYTYNNYLVTSKDANNVLTIEIVNNVSYIRVCGNGIKPDNMRVSINKDLDVYDFNDDYDEPHWFDIYVDSATGEMSTDDTGFATTAFLRYNKQNIYTFAVTEALVPYRVFFYDSSKAFISCTDQSNDLTCIIDYAPMGTAYFRFRGDYDNYNGTFTFSTAVSNVTYNVTQRPTYNVTNLVSTSQSVDSTAVYNGVGYKDNAYISTTNKVEGTVNGYVLTGLIPYTITKESAPTIYIRGVELHDDDSYPRFTLYNSEKTVVGIMHTTDLRETYFTKETLGDRYYKFTPVRAASTGDIRLSNNATGNAYISIGGKGLGEYLIVTLDEPIENNFTDLLDICDIKLNQRWSASSNGFEDKNGALAFSVPFSDIDGKTIKLVGFEPETNGISTWYAYKDGAAIGRIANPASGVIWTSSELVNNGDGSYDIPISTQIFKDLNRTDTPISVIPDTIYITMYTGSLAIDLVKVLVSN